MLDEIQQHNDVFGFAQGFVPPFAKFMVIVSTSAVNTALILLAFSAIGYVVAYLVEVIALGFSWKRPLRDFLTTRKCIGIVPINIDRLSFFDTGIGDSLLNHSAPYSDFASLEHVGTWISERLNEQEK